MHKNLIVYCENHFNASLSMYLILKNEVSAKINVKLLQLDRYPCTVTTLIYIYIYIYIYVLQDSIMLTVPGHVLVQC